MPVFRTDSFYLFELFWIRSYYIFTQLGISLLRGFIREIGPRNLKPLMIKTLQEN